MSLNINTDSYNLFSQQKVDSIFSQVDSNADGEISKDEFGDAIEEFSKILAKQVQSTSSTSSINEKIEELFSKMDTDKDGKVTKDELSAYIESQKKAPPPMPTEFNAMGLLTSSSEDEVFSEIDTNGDGIISLEELEAYLQRNQSQVDSGNVESNSTQSSTLLNITLQTDTQVA